MTVDSRQEPETGGEDRNRDASSPANCQLPTANSRLEVRLTGFGGQGVVLAAHIIGRACIEAGKHATMIQSFGPEARGASCSATLVISPDEVLYPYIQQPEILVAMSGDGYEKFKDELKPGGTLIYESDLVKPDATVILSREDGEGPPAEARDALKSGDPSPSTRLRMTRGYGVPSTRIAETLKKPMVQNIVMLGFIARVTKLVPVETMREVVRHSVPAGTEEINLQAFDAGAAYVEEVLEVV
ncbi:MAG: 2-oxoacid:acceptor oxidoreductase family protein [Thermoanaerobaculia bacterium]